MALTDSGVINLYTRALDLSPTETKRKKFDDSEANVNNDTTILDFGTTGAAAWIILDPLTSNSTKEGTGADPTPWPTAQNKGWKFDPDDLGMVADPNGTYRLIRPQDIDIDLNCRLTAADAVNNRLVRIGIYKIAAGGGATLLKQIDETFTPVQWPNGVQQTLTLDWDMAGGGDPEIELRSGESLQIEIWMKIVSVAVTGQTVVFRATSANGVGDGVDSRIHSNGEGMVYRFPRSVADTVAGTETPTRRFVGARLIADSNIASEAPTRAFIGARDITEILTTTEEPTRLFVGARAFSESIGPADDAVTRAFIGARTINDDAPANEAPTREFIGARAVTESVGPADDVVTRVAHFPREIAESVGPATDEVTRRVFFPRDISESIPTTEAPTRAFIGARSISESVGPADDVVTRLFVGSRAISESVGPADDTVTRLFVAIRDISESVGPADDSVARAFIGAREITDTVDGSDTVTRVYQGIRNVEDNIGPEGGGGVTVIQRPVFVFDE